MRYFIVLCAALAVFADPAEASEIRLVLQVTVDQLRGDLPRRYQDRFGEGGFRYLMNEGTVFEDAHHGHANTETIVGHATLATGAHPSTHGMIGNVWLDRSTARARYNIEDERYPILTEGAGVDGSTEIDPAQRAARTDGRSPAAMLTSTFGDELSLFTAGRAKVFAVSVKDRGAVSMAGHTGKAFWFSKSAGEFVTSSYYYDDYPAWVKTWNAKRSADRWGNKSWELLHEQETYLWGERDDRSFETDLAGFGRVFPHPYGAVTGQYYTTLLTVSPVGDAITLDFAKTLIEHESLGDDAVPDYLGVSFSSTDYVGHIFGPSSLESEDNLLRLDRALADLFRFVDEHVGLEYTLIVLSADHGAAEAPPYLRELGIQAGYVDLTDSIDRFDHADLISAYQHPYVYVDRARIVAEGLDEEVILDAIAEELTAIPGVAYALTSARVASGQLPDTRLTRQVSRNFNPRRSGDIYVVLEPHSMINDFDGLEVAATHGSPWRYDTYVPIMFAGIGIKPQRVARYVLTVDVAPTLAILVGTKPPSGSVGKPLTEVIAR